MGHFTVSCEFRCRSPPHAKSDGWMSRGTSHLRPFAGPGPSVIFCSCPCPSAIRVTNHGFREDIATHCPRPKGRGRRPKAGWGGVYRYSLCGRDRGGGSIPSKTFDLLMLTPFAPRTSVLKLALLALRILRVFELRFSKPDGFSNSCPADSPSPEHRTPRQPLLAPSVFTLPFCEPSRKKS